MSGTRGFYDLAGQEFGDTYDRLQVGDLVLLDRGVVARLAYWGEAKPVNGCTYELRRGDETKKTDRA